MNKKQKLTSQEAQGNRQEKETIRNNPVKFMAHVSKKQVSMMHSVLLPTFPLVL